MVIKDIQLIRGKHVTILSAKCKIRKIGWDTVFFSVDSKRSDYVVSDASPFASALLLPSMKQGEDLIIKGSISKHLHAGMQEIMKEVLTWGIGLHPIEIKAESLTVDKYEPRKTATFFSGGVDSFYTYLKHKNDPDKANRVDSFILVDGFDIDPRNEELWKLTEKNIKAIADAENIELVEVKSNIHELLEPILIWDYTHGGCLAAVGLFLRNEYRRIYIPSTHSVGEQIPWGSNLELDKHWSTESVVFVHDGTEATRLNKVIWQISKSPIALKHLRVCYMNTKGAYNCGTCDKCLRTMINLYIAGSLERAVTFPSKIDVALVAEVPTIKGEHGGIFHSENLNALKERKLAPDLQEAIISSLNKTQNIKPRKLEVFKNKIIYLDHVYAEGSTYTVLSRLFGKKFA